MYKWYVHIYIGTMYGSYSQKLIYFVHLPFYVNIRNYLNEYIFQKKICTFYFSFFITVAFLQKEF